MQKRYKKLKTILPKRIYHLIDVVASYRPMSMSFLREKYDVKRISEDDLLDLAKKLHASVYLYRGFISKTDIENGVIHEKADPYQRHAEYFGVIDKASGDVVALARQIHQKFGNPLPIFQHAPLSKDYSLLDKNDVVEISAFVKRPGEDNRVVYLLFHEMLSHSHKNNHRYWLLACDTHVYGRLKTLFGPVIRRVGPTVFYMGSNVVPAEVDLERGPRALYLGYMFSLPPLRGIRKYLYSSFAHKQNEISKKAIFTPTTYFWNNYAKAYDGLLHFHPYRHLVDHVSDVVISYKPKLVLDLGCGTGNVAKTISSKDSSIEIDAVDWSHSMLSRLRTKVSPWDHINIIEKDLLRFLAFSKKEYDVIVLNNVVYTITDRKRLWTLLSKRLAKNGRIVIANPDNGDSRGLIKNHKDHGGTVSLFRPSLVTVFLFDLAISFSGVRKKYDFTKKADLISEIKKNGLELDGTVGRCYGGHETGIDLLFSIKLRRLNEV